jgi:hypothetical protein
MLLRCAGPRAGALYHRVWGLKAQKGGIVATTQASFFDVAAFEEAERLMAEAHDAVERVQMDVQTRLQAGLEERADPPAPSDVGALFSFAGGVRLHEHEFGQFATRLNRDVGETDSRRLDAEHRIARTERSVN